MAKQEYKVGDLVRVKAAGYHRFEDGAVVRLVSKPDRCLPLWECRRGGKVYPLSQVVWESDMEPYTQTEKIVIISDGKTTTATLYEGKRCKTEAKAVCSPEDTFDLATGAKLALDRLLGVEPEKPKLFPLEDIKAGYLLEVKEDDDSIYYMTVAPSRCRGENDGILACCCPEKEWWPLREFSEDLIYHDAEGEPKIIAIYGLASPRYIATNAHTDRPLLWRRGE